MKTLEITNDMDQKEIVENTGGEAITSSAKAASESRRDAPLRYTLLLALTVLVGWIAFSAYSATNEIGTTMDAIDNLLRQPVSRGR